MARKRASEKKSKSPIIPRSTIYYTIIGLIIIVVIILLAIFVINMQENSNIDSGQTDKWLFAMDTAEEAVGSKTEYSTGYIPTLVIIGPSGNIAYKNYGVHSKEDLLEYIESIEEGTADNLGAAPDFTLETINDETFTLSDCKGKTVVLDLMAVRCPPCKTQMPELQALNQEKSDSIVILSIDVDGAYGHESERDVISTFSKYVKR